MLYIPFNFYLFFHLHLYIIFNCLRTNTWDLYLNVEYCFLLDSFPSYGIKNEKLQI